MFSEFKNIDVNLTSLTETQSSPCIWFTILVAVHEEPGGTEGEVTYKYEYVFFPHTANKEDDVVFRTLDAPYYPNLYYGSLL